MSRYIFIKKNIRMYGEMCDFIVFGNFLYIAKSRERFRLIIDFII